MQLVLSKISLYSDMKIAYHILNYPYSKIKYRNLISTKIQLFKMVTNKAICTFHMLLTHEQGDDGYYHTAPVLY
jgi:hypothetical protein